MATIFLTNSSPGAPTLNGVNGALCNVLDWALVQNGWSIEYTATNRRIYRAGTGLRHRIFVAHDSAVSGNVNSATVRGCENATAANESNLIDPFPTVAQVANGPSSWLITDANVPTTARNYIIVVGTTFFIMFIKLGASTPQYWDMNFFGEMPKNFAADTWNTVITVRNNTTIANSTGWIGGAVTSSRVFASSLMYFARSIDGSVKSTRGSLVCLASSSGLGFISGLPAPRAGYGNTIVREKVALGCAGSTTTSSDTALLVNRRCWLPNIYNPMHSGSGTLDDTYTFVDSAYNPVASFQTIAGLSGSSGMVILETTDTWSAPPYA